MLEYDDDVPMHEAPLAQYGKIDGIKTHLKLLLFSLKKKTIRTIQEG